MTGHTTSRGGINIYRCLCILITIIISLFTAALETYHVYVTTGNVSGAGTDANVWITLFGESDDTGTLK